MELENLSVTVISTPWKEELHWKIISLVFLERAGLGSHLHTTYLLSSQIYRDIHTLSYAHHVPKVVVLELCRELSISILIVQKH
jgi:hypothetical protein